MGKQSAATKNYLQPRKQDNERFVELVNELFEKKINTQNIDKINLNVGLVLNEGVRGKMYCNKMTWKKNTSNETSLFLFYQFSCQQHHFELFGLVLVASDQLATFDSGAPLLQGSWP